MLAAAAAHLDAGHQAGADGGSVGVAENDAALIDRQVNAAHPGRLADPVDRDHAGNGR
jgi:hypothetical protein